MTELEQELLAARVTIEELLFALESMLNLTLDEDDIAVSSRVTVARAVIARAKAKGAEV
jgi:hypothetical protein